MTYPRFSFKTTPRHGRFFHTIIEDHGASGFMAQLTKCPSVPDPNNIHSEEIILDLFPTLEAACEAVNYPYDVAGLPTLK